MLGPRSYTVRTSLCAAALLVATLAPTPASAASAWDVARRVIPGGLSFVGGANVQAVVGSAAWKALLAAVVAEGGENALSAQDQVKARCGFDPLQIVDRVVVALDHRQRGAVFVSFRGASQDRVAACIASVLAASDDDYRMEAMGRVVAYRRSADDVVWTAWIDGVLVVPTDVEHRDVLDAMIGGKGAARDAILIRALQQVDTGAAAWGVYADPEVAREIEEAEGFRWAAASLGLGDGATARGVVSFALGTQAERLAGALRAQLDRVADDLPPPLAAVVRKLRLEQKGETIRFSVNVGRGELPQVLELLVRKM